MLAFPTLAAAALALLPAFSLGQTTNTTGLPTCALTCTLSSLPGTACEAQGVSPAQNWRHRFRKWWGPTGKGGFYLAD